MRYVYWIMSPPLNCSEHFTVVAPLPYFVFAMDRFVWIIITGMFIDGKRNISCCYVRFSVSIGTCSPLNLRCHQYRSVTRVVNSLNLVVRDLVNLVSVNIYSWLEFTTVSYMSPCVGMFLVYLTEIHPIYSNSNNYISKTMMIRLFACKKNEKNVTVCRLRSPFR